MDQLLVPDKEAIFYEDEKVYACLASYPVTPGHSLVVWKEKVKDLSLLSKSDYDYLMEIVDKVRSQLMKKLSVDKVYLVYMDEAQQVHWHLIPRYNTSGFNIFYHEPEKTKNFRLAPELKEGLA